jgi:hypothetical protein
MLNWPSGRWINMRSASAKLMTREHRSLVTPLRMRAAACAIFVGKKDWSLVRRAMREQRVRLRDMLQPPEGIGRDYARLDKARKRKVDAVLKEIGISRMELIRIGAAFQERVQKVAPAANGNVVPGYYMPNNIAKWTDLSPLHRLPLPWGVVAPVDDPNDPHRWFLFRPPFWDFPDRFVHVESDGFGVSATHSSHAFAGYVGHDVTMNLDDADSYDFAQALVDTRMGFIFEVLADGLVEVLIDAQNATGTHDLKTRDEWGWSETSTSQTNYLIAHVLHPNVPEPSLAEMSNFYDDDIETTVHRENLIPGEHYFAHFISAGTVAAGQSIAILVGTHNFEICSANDVGYHSDTSFHWLIRSVEVRIRQAP